MERTKFSKQSSSVNVPVRRTKAPISTDTYKAKIPPKAIVRTIKPGERKGEVEIKKEPRPKARDLETFFCPFFKRIDVAASTLEKATNLMRCGSCDKKVEDAMKINTLVPKCSGPVQRTMINGHINPPYYSKEDIRRLGL